MASDNIQIFTDGNFAQTVVKSDKPVLVDFWAEWCGPCRRLAPTVAALATTYDGRSLGQAERRREPEHGGAIQHCGIPTILISRAARCGVVVGLADKDHSSSLRQARLTTKTTPRHDSHIETCMVGSGPAGLTQPLRGPRQPQNRCSSRASRQAAS